MNTERVMLTRAGANRLHAELQQLKTVTRPAIVAAIAEARAHGDLSENAEYHAAKEQQRLTENRIAQLESGLAGAEIVKLSKPTTDEPPVVFGATVKLYDLNTENEVTYQVVGGLEADIEHGRISTNSPIGRALLGKCAGEEVAINAPAGKRIYEILAVEYL